MMRVLTFLVLAVLAFAEASLAAITCSATNFTETATSTNANPTVVITIPSQTYRRTIIAVLDRSETSTDPSISDTQGGTWTKRDGPLDTSYTTARVWLYDRDNAGSTGSVTITVGLASAVNSDIVAGTCYSDTADLTYVSSGAMQDYSSTTAWSTSSRTFTATGVIFGYAGGANNTTVPTPTSTVLNTSTARMRIFAQTGNSGSASISETLSVNNTGVFGVSLYQEAASAATFYNRRTKVIE